MRVKRNMLCVPKITLLNDMILEFMLGGNSSRKASVCVRVSTSIFV